MCFSCVLCALCVCCAQCVQCVQCSWCVHYACCALCAHGAHTMCTVWPVHCVCHCSWCTATQPSVCTHCTVTACVPMCTALSALVRPSPMAPAHSPRAHHSHSRLALLPVHAHSLPLTAPSAWGPCDVRCATWLCGAAAGALAPHCGCSLACGAATRVQCCVPSGCSLRSVCGQHQPAQLGAHPHPSGDVAVWQAHSSPLAPHWWLLSRVCDCHACPPLCV